jgi:hypothetical protein
LADGGGRIGGGSEGGDDFGGAGRGHGSGTIMPELERRRLKLERGGLTVFAESPFRTPSMRTS